MGTNFYTMKGRHIGKRSAAGRYCWDCHVSLCKRGPDHVHDDADWFDHCPICGKKPEKEGYSGAAGRELGFNNEPFSRKSGVKSCSSFTWDIEPRTLKAKTIKDEYGAVFTRSEFDQILTECPIQFFDSIGRDFR